METQKNYLKLVEELLEFVDVCSMYYNAHKYKREPTEFKFKQYRTNFVAIYEQGLCCNMIDGDKYLASFEVQYNPNQVVFNMRLPDFCVLWDGRFGYCKNLPDLGATPAFEYSGLKNIQYCDDLDESTLFQYRIIEQEVDTILVLMNKLREIRTSNEYTELLRAPFRK